MFAESRRPLARYPGMSITHKLPIDMVFIKCVILCEKYVFDRQRRGSWTLCCLNVQFIKQGGSMKIKKVQMCRDDNKYRKKSINKKRRKDAKSPRQIKRKRRKMQKEKGE